MEEVEFKKVSKDIQILSELFGDKQTVLRQQTPETVPVLMKG